ncbi:1,4-dihydroxy-2-naphthoate octaprenyltransferase [Bifidobacterium avesanii]|uniref:1,4-dihydroxy-2-naphthoate octaprenyltransferase n=1 Tax=Bifidobacterium avesanii TaxID=1798157 RepID=UPI0013D5B989|nr:1,4-dihydroxy-2-naphthoate octaprenyltransferase [Bifidobacterium avesanii]
MSPCLWLVGARPRTLPASIAPVAVGAAAAWRSVLPPACPELFPQPGWCTAAQMRYQMFGSRFWVVTVLCAAVALLLQIAVNFANDYSDGIRGSDANRGESSGESSGEPTAKASVRSGADPSRPGAFQRLVASGVPPRLVLAAAGVASGAACVCGLAAIAVTRAWWLLAVGAVSLLAGWFYTGGRHPYGYAGFGELSVFAFFGLAAVLGTEYALTGGLDPPGALGAVCCGLNAVMLLMVNNLRDLNDDRAHGKRTLAVRLGERAARAALAVCAASEVLVGAAAGWLLWGAVGAAAMLIAGAVLPWRLARCAWARAFRPAFMAASGQSLAFAALFVLCAVLPAMVPGLFLGV